MKFKTVVGNPPYHLINTNIESEKDGEIMPIYNFFISDIKKYTKQYMDLIIPARWYNGGIGLDEFREEMLSDKHMQVLVDYPNSKDCFSTLSVSGGICCFLRNTKYSGDCLYIENGKKSMRKLNEFPTFIRYSMAVSIVKKAKKKMMFPLYEYMFSINYFGIDFDKEQHISDYPNKVNDDDCFVYSKYGKGYVTRAEIKDRARVLDKYKVMIGRLTAEHANEADKNGRYRVLSTMKIMNPGEVCGVSYVVVGGYDDKKKAENVIKYLKTKFVRFLLLQAISSTHISKKTFVYVPMEDFDIEWTDEKLYEKYELTKEEIEFIDGLIK